MLFLWECLIIEANLCATSCSGEKNPAVGLVLLCGYKKNMAEKKLEQESETI